MQLKQWYAANQAYPRVVARMTAAWEGCASHWAWWGRLDILDLHANTNNLAERCFGMIKYSDLNRDTQSTVHRLVCVLVEKTVPRYMHMRGLMLAGRLKSDQQRAEERATSWASELVSTGKVAPAARGPPGLTFVKGHKVCVGDLSCDCEYAGERAPRGAMAACTQAEKHETSWHSVARRERFACSSIACYAYHIYDIYANTLRMRPFNGS